MQEPEKEHVQDLIPVQKVDGVNYDRHMREREAREKAVRSHIFMRPGWGVIRNPQDPRLYVKAKTVKNPQDFDTVEMAKTLVGHHLIEGGLGLAATQIGWNAKVCAIAVLDSLGRPTTQTILLFNPRIIGTDDMTDDNMAWGTEGCLSMPGYWGTVLRPKHCKFVASTLTHPKEKVYDTREVCPQAPEMFCRVLFHEVQHLQGKLWNDKSNHFKYLGVDPAGQVLLMEETRKAEEFGLPEVQE